MTVLFEYDGLTEAEENAAVQAIFEIQSTDEGQYLFQQLVANEEYSNIYIRFTTAGVSSFSEGWFGFNGILTININDIRNEGYHTADGGVGLFSLQHVLVHEIFHIVDSNTSDAFNIREARSIQFTNEYMAKYYGEERRIDHEFENFGDNNLPENSQLLNTNFTQNGVEGYTFIGKEGENIIDLLTDMGTDEFANNAENYFYKVIVASNGIDSTIVNALNLFQNGIEMPERLGWGDPLVIDLDGDGIELRGVGFGATQFDLSGDGTLDRVGWVGADDGLLVRDRNANGTIDDIDELYGTEEVSGFDKLAVDEAADGNGDRVLNSSDALYSELRVWRDSNADGITQTGELLTLQQAGITSIDFRDGAWA